ncbi:ubiquinol-cytochrome C reductase [Jimgerdemannia flammicorona]|uniref:Complex III subunit 9 n=1 Tax=Jimgerdemannia flammicorona TaxID=994334 RepID=A0A433D9N0_9FUNG|nr:ubiquinol-cytochrome C reductase [Jimgerdemannia flammicorona]
MPNAAAASSGANKLGRLVYNTFVKRNSVFVATIFVSAFAFEIAFDEGTSKLWDNLNKGTSSRNKFSTPLFCLITIQTIIFVKGGPRLTHVDLETILEIAS